MPRYAAAAQFNQGTERVPCTEDTRTEILDAIYHWFNRDHFEMYDVLPIEGNINGRIFWLDGLAGTEKSTIAQTIADHFDRSGKLGASFFCSRDDAKRSNINLIFPTIARQLSSSNPAFKKHISEAMRKDPNVEYALMSRQLKKLVIEPLHAVMCEGTFSPCIIVIDALDECNEKSAISTILLLSKSFLALYLQSCSSSQAGLKRMLCCSGVPRHGPDERCERIGPS